MTLGVGLMKCMNAIKRAHLSRLYHHNCMVLKYNISLSSMSTLKFVVFSLVILAVTLQMLHAEPIPMVRFHDMHLVTILL